MQNLQEGASSIRLAELMAALSLATDLGMGQPLEYALCSCVLAMRLGEALGLSESELREVYYQALLRFVGCNAETALLASLLGDELSLRADYARIGAGRTAEVVGVVVRHIRQAHAGASPLLIARKVAEGLLSGPKVTREVFEGHCEVAQRLAARLGFSSTIIRALGQLYERWDGRGQPGGLKGEEIALSVRVVMLAQDAITFHRLGGSEAAVAMARERKGGVYDRAWWNVSVSGSQASWPGWTMSHPGWRCWRWSLGCASTWRTSSLMQPARRLQTLPISNPPTRSVTLPAWPNWRQARQAAVGCQRRMLSPSGAPVCCMMSGALASPQPSGRSPVPSLSANGSRFVCIPTIPSACWRARRNSPGWARWRRCTTSGWMAPAIIAAGGSPLGLGTDIGGSLRVPATFCGIASMKPTDGRLPDAGRYSVPIGERAIVSQVGVLARRVVDVSFGLEIINGGRNPTVEPPMPLGDLAAVEVSKLRVAYYTDDGTFQVAPAVRRAVLEAAHTLKRAGAQVTEWRPPDGQFAADLWLGIISADGGQGFKETLGKNKRDRRVKPLLLFAPHSRPTLAALRCLPIRMGVSMICSLLAATRRSIICWAIPPGWSL